MFIIMMTIPRRGHTCGHSTAYLHLSRLTSPQVCISSSPLLPQMPASNPQHDEPVPITTLDEPPGSRWHHRIPRRRSAHPPSFSSDLTLRKKQEPARLGLHVVTAPFRIPRMVKSPIDKDILKMLTRRSVFWCCVKSPLVSGPPDRDL